MKKCTKCGKTYDDSFKFCSDCGIELVEENQEEKEVEVEEKSATDENVEFCVYCGGIITPKKATVSNAVSQQGLKEKDIALNVVQC